MTSELIVNESTDYDAVYQQFQQATIIEDFFDTFCAVLDDQSFRWALQHSSLFAKDASKEEYQVYLGHFVPDTIKGRLNKLADKRKYDEFIDMEISINKEHQSQLSTASTSTNQNDDGASQKRDKQKAKVVEQVIPDIPASAPELVVIPQPQVVLQFASSSSLKPTAKPFVSRTKGEKSKDKSHDLGDDATQIITGYRLNPSLGQYVCDILIYDVPAKWENITILDYLKAWSNVISVTVKKQKKYKTVWCKLEIMHAFDTWERDRLWIAPLRPVVAVIQGPPDSFIADALAVKEHLTNFINPLHIKAFKEVKNPDGSCKMIAYFESWEDLQNIISKESFWNGTKLSWYRHTVLSFITRRKNSQRSSSNRQDNPIKLSQDPPSKHTKLSSGSKSGSSATGTNRVPIRSPQKDSSQSSSGNKTGEKNKQSSRKKKDKSTGTSPPRSCQNDNCMLRL
ncbi:hypothetical protein RclHR1_25680001 [Rhizophagus clarus]|uniref:Uncharacterized protein n=1 Tax=Rhizophagus clarus TaxID=94130 RepID=A0A2Z6RU27_9GLOM|nr:hypothetical protein RclHR1_25680001 [Rhizophagus clarus]